MCVCVCVYTCIEKVKGQQGVGTLAMSTTMDQDIDLVDYGEGWRMEPYFSFLVTSRTN